MADDEKNYSGNPEDESALDSQLTPFHGDIEDKEKIEDLVHVIDDEDDGMPVIPLRGVTIFPTMLLHFDVGREKSISALENAMMTNQKVFLITQKNAETDLPTQDDFYEVGTTAHIKQMLRLPGNSIKVLAEGISRGRIGHMIQEVPFFKAKIEILDDIYRDEDEIRITALRRVVLEQFREYLNYSQKISSEIYPGIEAIENSGRMADIITSHLDISMEDKESVLAATDIRERLERVSDIILKEIEVTKIESEIAEKVRSNISGSQKEYFLREQIKTIQEELGQDETLDEEVDKWLAQLEELHLDQPVHDKIEKEILRVRKLQPQSPDVSVMRTYIELVLGLPWNNSTKDRLDLKKMQKILDEEHYGLEKVKERIIEYMAVRILSKDFKGHILCLVGPPGVGKTSIAKSVAHSMNRKFVRMSLGGVRDEAEIRGHRRTYVGAIPGRIISSINDAGVNNPVFLLDEIDKVGNDYRGDPASALLEALDPEQNSTFKDHYLDVPFDLSHVLFITTANTTETIPAPLLDRMDIIQLSSYTLEEKVKIAEQHLVPKQIKENGLKPSQISFSEGAIRGIINYYTREAGVRNLERAIGKICRKVVRKIVEGGAAEKKKNHRITAGNLTSYLGNKKATYDKIEPGSEVGVTTGMAWTAVGGETLFIETAVMHGTGKLMLTGQLGDVMQESAKTALSVIRERSDKLGLPENFYEKNDIHVHIPEGAIPKDGPSAGVTMCTSMVSALTDTPVKRDIAMTGEITLRGKVLPVGGIKEKVIAAHRAGAVEILLPEENMMDLDELPSNVRNNLKFKPIKYIDDVFEEALVKKQES
ncbi:MAG: endopeptidase La [Anaerovoracaceae bacterium]|jgi:ATP-dependent Lon protease